MSKANKPAAPPDLGPIDTHVHIVGNGTGGTGCWLRVKGWHRPMAAFMLRHIGLPWGAMSGDFDRLYTRFWERMAEAGLPLLAHTGGEHTVPIIRREFSDPRILELPLQCGVNVIAAHCGTKSGASDPDFFPVFVEMLHHHSNLYG